MELESLKPNQPNETEKPTEPDSSPEDHPEQKPRIPKVTRLKKIFPPTGEEREPGKHQFDYLAKERGDIGGAIGPNFLIFAGITLLLNTLGLVPWQVWPYLFRFWPIFLVFAGIQLVIVLFHSSKLVTLLMGAVSFVTFLFITITAISATDSKLFGQLLNINLPEWWKTVTLLIQEAGEK